MLETVLVCLQCPCPNTVANTLGTKVSAVTRSTVELVILVAARGRVQPLVTRGAREAAPVPRLVGGLYLLCKINSFLTFGANVASTPSWFGSSRC